MTLDNFARAAACHAVAVPFLTAHLDRQRAFSLRTFGLGSLYHI